MFCLGLGTLSARDNTPENHSERDQRENVNRERQEPEGPERHQVYVVCCRTKEFIWSCPLLSRTPQPVFPFPSHSLQPACGQCGNRRPHHQNPPSVSIDPPSASPPVPAVCGHGQDVFTSARTALFPAPVYHRRSHHQASNDLGTSDLLEVLRLAGASESAGGLADTDGWFSRRRGKRVTG